MPSAPLNFAELEKITMSGLNEAVLWMDESGVIFHVNEIATMHLQAPDKQLLGNRITDILDDFSKEKFHTFWQRAKHEQTFDQTHKTSLDGMFNQELKITWKYLEFNGLNCLCAMCSIEAASKAVSQLFASKYKFQKVFAKFTNPVFVIDPKTDAIIDVNRAAIYFTGFDRTTLLKKTVTAVSSGEIFGAEQRKKYQVEATPITIAEKVYIIAIARKLADLTEAQLALQKSEERLKLSLNASRDGLYDINLANETYFLSANFYRMLGYLPDEITFDFKSWEHYLHPDDRRRVKLRRHQYLRGEIRSHSEEYRILCKFGNYKWIRDRGKVVEQNKDGLPVRLVGTYIDISQQKEVEQALERRIAVEEIVADISASFVSVNPEHVDQAIVDALSRTGTFIGAERGHVFLFTPSGLTIRCTHSWSEKGIILRDVPAVPMLLNYEDWLMEQLCEFEIVGFNNIADLPDEAEGYREFFKAENILAAIAVPMGYGDCLEGFIRFETSGKTADWQHQDFRLLKIVAELITSAIHRKQSWYDLRFAKEEAETFNHAKSEFLTNMSHEFRTPLNAILGYAQALQGAENLTEKQHNELNIVEKSGTHLLTLITDLLDLSKIEAGKFEIEPTAFDVFEIVESVMDINRLRAQKKKIAFSKKISPDISQTLQGDVKRLRQILLNIIGNAVKFTPANGTVEIQVFQLKVEDNQTWIRFVVKDSGCGIPEEKRELIFEPFQQIGKAKQQFEGTGLGLTISKRLIELMNGTLQVESEVGVGSQFIVDLPFEVIPVSSVLKENKEFRTENKIEASKKEKIPALKYISSMINASKRGEIMTVRRTLQELKSVGECSEFVAEVKQFSDAYDLQGLHNFLLELTEQRSLL